MRGFQKEKSTHWFFWSLLNEGDIGLTDASIIYVVHLLERFSRSDKLYAGTDKGKPTVFEYLERVEDADPIEQIQLYQHIGDISLFLVSLFEKSLMASKSYYIGVGSNAYNTLASRVREATRAVVFQELGDRFSDIVGSISKVRE
jgi:hypothetical protein